MGRILEYVVLLSNLSLILGTQQYKEAVGTNYEEKQGNFSHVVKQSFPKEQDEFFNKKVLPLELATLRRLSPPKPKQMRNSLGLHAFGENTELRLRRRSFSDPNGRKSNLLKKNALAFSQYPRIHSKNSFFKGEIPSQRLSRLNSDFANRYHKGRNVKYHPRHQAKVCDPCNNVPWVPLLKVSDSYRQQRTHVTELHPTPQQNFNVDYHGFATDAHNVFLPPVPLVPPLEPIYDGTISSSFGLPAGNIPTGHGLLAPLNHLATQPTVDYSSSFNFFSPPTLLETHPFPALSPVPIVPIHDSGQFYQFDSSIPDLVPPPSQNLDVSKVVLTISEDNVPDLLPPKPPTHKPETVHAQDKKKQSIDFGKLEIVKSIPLAEFTASSSELPLYPPLQKGYSTEFGSKSATKSTSDVSFTTTKSYAQAPDKSEPQGEHSAPKPLTSPSLSWLFTDHTAPPSDSKASASVSSYATEIQEIASVVNNELRPVSPNPLPISSGKSKKIQIIIPYTTKNKNEHDNNAVESVRHEVFQPPASKSTTEGDSANSTPPSLTEATVKPEDEHITRKYLTEMHHIIASNIRQLLREEIEKSQKEQNYPLQNNIDNWTALEYSNHKTLETKAPKEIISQALAVTSIPGTSISHLLLPSKKIPNEYFATTPTPEYDEPSTPSFKATNSTVNSSPFTAKPYATTSLYTTRRENKEDVQSNHEKSYTEVGRGKVNNWGKLNENLIVPEARRKFGGRELTTPSMSSERLEIVTPVSTQTNHTTTAFRRTTREVRRDEETTTPKPAFLTRLNSTRLEKVSNQTAPFNRKYTHATTRGASRTNGSSVETSTVGGNVTSEDPNLNGKSEQLSINDIIPFRNKELPWESHPSSSQTVYRATGERKSLIKQVSLPKSKAGSS